MIMQPQNFNSAGRLLNLINSIPKGIPLNEAIPILIDLETTNQVVKQKATLEFLNELSLVYKEFCQDMQDLDLDQQKKNTMLAELANIEQTIYPISLGATVRELLDNETATLKICATFIKKEDEIALDDLDAIRNEIVSLRTSIEKSEVSSALKKFLLDLIRQCENSISSYKIHGARGLRRSLKSMVADLKEIYDNDDFKKELNKSEFFNRFVSFIRLTDTVASKYLEYKPYIDSGLSILFYTPPS